MAPTRLAFIQVNGKTTSLGGNPDPVIPLLSHQDLTCYWSIH